MREEDMGIVKSLVSVAWADGHFDEKEREMVEALISAFEASEEQAAEIRAYAAEKKSLDDIPVWDMSFNDRRVLLQHAVLLTYVDGEQHVSEKQFVQDLCVKLEIEPEEAKKIVETAEHRAKKHLNLL
ncbi:MULTISPECIES: TerB family tellurite resistance protein [Polyangium]|uniref:TerB family tellurite resistance protein n=2 Tax=Polyangium TaxID=55 RepID=A0A4U1JE89_9BACT|nr:MULTISPECIES: TerB family tellurite resistance protein [Polyangium]MDI1436311.1 TerB family tellurite resistance protein [Polyangium sorediatum]TKD09399.1 TerB family tellurite resistance protein [Polyangium fumosum]